MPDHDRQADIRKVAKILRSGKYSYDQSADLFKKARREVGLSPPDRSGQGSPERLSTEEQEAFLKAAYDRDGRTGLMMRTLLETGARVSAFVKIRVEDVAFRDLEIRLRETKGDSLAMYRFFRPWPMNYSFTWATVRPAGCFGRAREGTTQGAASSKLSRT